MQALTNAINKYRIVTKVSRYVPHREIRYRDNTSDNGYRHLPGFPLADFIGHSIGCVDVLHADKSIVNIHVYFYEATDSPTECIAASFEHKSRWLRF